MAVNINDVTAKVKGRGISYQTFMYTQNSALPIFFYDYATLNSGDSKDLKIKDLPFESVLSEDGNTVEWREEDIRIPSTNAVAISAIGATTITVTTGTGSNYAVGDILTVVETGEDVKIASIAGDVLTLTSVLTSAVAVDDNLTYVIYDGAVARPVSQKYSVEQTNVAHYEEHEVTITKADLNKSYEDLESGVDHFMRLAKTGIRKIMKGVNNSFYKGVAGGINGLENIIIAGNKVDLSAAAGENKFQKFVRALDPVMEVAPSEGSDEAFLLCTTAAAAALIDLIPDSAAGTVRTNKDYDKLKTMGVHIQTIDTTLGVINVMRDNSLDELYGRNANVAFALKPTFVKMVTFPMYPSADASGMPAAEKIEGIGIFEPAQTSPTEKKIVLFTNYSFIFGAVTANAYVKLTNIGVES